MCIPPKHKQESFFKKNWYLQLMGGQSTSPISPLAIKLRIEINPNE